MSARESEKKMTVFRIDISDYPHFPRGRSPPLFSGGDGWRTNPSPSRDRKQATRNGREPSPFPWNWRKLNHYSQGVSAASSSWGDFLDVCQLVSCIFFLPLPPCDEGLWVSILLVKLPCLFFVYLLERFQNHRTWIHILPTVVSVIFVAPTGPYECSANESFRNAIWSSLLSLLLEFSGKCFTLSLLVRQPIGVSYSYGHALHMRGEIALRRIDKRAVSTRKNGTTSIRVG